jgi:hypothetical protein
VLDTTCGQSGIDPVIQPKGPFPTATPESFPEQAHTLVRLSTDINGRMLGQDNHGGS